MTPAPHPFASLIGPLRYACRRDFAYLGLVKDLRSPLAAAIQAGRARIDPAIIASLERELANVDHAHPQLRRESLKRIVSALSASGIELPGELKEVLAATPATPQAGDSVRATVTPSEPRPEPQPIPRARQSRLTLEKEKRSEPGDANAPAPAAAKKRGAKGKRVEVKPDTRAEARLLSIAPRSGPLATPLANVGWRLNPRLISALNRKGLRKAGDVLFLLPRVYEDRRRLKKIAQLQPGERGVTVGVVQRAGDSFVKGGRRRIFRAVIADETGSISVTFFQSGPWLKARFPIGKRLVVSGELRASLSGREISHPEIEPADDLEGSAIHFNRIVPVYPGFERHEQRAFRELAFKVREKYGHEIDEPLPESLRSKLGLMGLAEALGTIHFPADDEDLERLDQHMSPAHRRLAFDELFFLQLGMALKRQGVKVEPGISFDTSKERLERAKKLLPFELTKAQARVVDEVAKDMRKSEPMNRLLQGDVGSGKTAVALVTAALALQDGYQVAVMAPTEILAEQHYRNFQRLLEPMGVKVGLVSAGGGAKQKREVRGALAKGEIRCAVGTHALIQEGVEFEKLGVVLIDEQHRFGVIQRHALMSKGRRPDVLVMTATPIPRTLAMTLYGDLELSVIDELPPGRTPIVTRVYSDKQRARVYEQLQAELDKGHQAYVVYPLVEESEKLDLEDATQGAEKLQAVFPNHVVGLLHGRMKQDEKEAVMRDFRERKTHILVSTTVIEVGVDVPNASVMVIEAAERFGLSQLHQLRGRVGRGAAASFCFLVAGFARSQESADRLQVMEKSNSGFVIAEEDLKIRGPGEFLGTRQSGIPELAVANLARDSDLLARAQTEARAIVEQDPGLHWPEHLSLVKALEERWEGRLSLARVG